MCTDTIIIIISSRTLRAGLWPPPRAASRLACVTRRRPRTADPTCRAQSSERPKSGTPGRRTDPAQGARVGHGLARVGHRGRGPYLVAPPREPARGVASPPTRLYAPAPPGGSSRAPFLFVQNNCTQHIPWYLVLLTSSTIVSRSRSPENSPNTHTIRKIDNCATTCEQSCMDHTGFLYQSTV